MLPLITPQMAPLTSRCPLRFSPRSGIICSSRTSLARITPLGESEPQPYSSAGNLTRRAAGRTALLRGISRCWTPLPSLCLALEITARNFKSRKPAVHVREQRQQLQRTLLDLNSASLRLCTEPGALLQYRRVHIVRSALPRFAGVPGMQLPGGGFTTSPASTTYICTTPTPRLHHHVQRGCSGDAVRGSEH